MLTSPDDLKRVRKGFIRSIFNISYATISKWMIDIREIGADNEDDTFDLIKIIRWRCELKLGRPLKNPDDNPMLALEIEKKQKEIEYKDAQIIRMQERYIERSISEQEKVSLLKSIRLFFERAPAFQKQKFHMIPSDIAEARLRDYGKEAMEQI